MSMAMAESSSWSRFVSWDLFTLFILNDLSVEFICFESMFSEDISCFYVPQFFMVAFGDIWIFE
jgi:hypothetical protein